MAENNGKAPPPDWAAFQPPDLPENEKLEEMLRKLARMSPEQILKRSVASGIHSSLGGLTEQYKLKRY